MRSGLNGSRYSHEGIKTRRHKNKGRHEFEREIVEK